MGVLRKLFAGPPSSTSVAQHSLSSVALDAALAAAMSPAGDRLGVAAILRARQMSADVMGSLPILAGETPIPAPNSDDTVADFVTATVLSLQDYGDAYWVRDRQDWYVVPAASVTARWNQNKTRRLYSQGDRNLRAGGLNPTVIVLSVNRTAEALEGVGWMQSSRIAGVLAAQQYAEDYWANNASPVGLLSVPGQMDPEDAAKLKAQWKAQQATRDLGVISSGMTFDQVGFSPTDSQWVETHRVGVADTSLLSGVPGALLDVGIQGSAITYSNTGDVESLWVRNALRPYYGRRLEQGFERMFGSVVKVQYEGLELANLSARSVSANQLVLAGYDPDSVADTVGLDGLEHTGAAPNTVQQEDTADAAS